MFASPCLAGINSGIHTLIITLFFLLAPVAAWDGRPNVLVPVSNATCQPEYAWMNNAQQRSPCLTVAYVIAACVGDTWTQPALPSGYSYDSPNGTTATPCYCSWSCYNLMMACTLCQNPAYTNEITTWPSFSQNCSTNYKDEVFPQGYVLADNASIPYWATINPETWSSELFNIGQAENYANQNHSDYWPSSETVSSSSNSSGSNPDVGAIIGGTIGGIAGLLLILIGIYFLHKRRQHRQVHNGDTPVLQMSTPIANTLTRSPPGPTGPSTFSLTPTNSPPPPPMSHMTSQPQEVGSASSMYTSTPYSSFQVSSAPLPETASFLPAASTAVQRSRAIPIV